MPSIYLFSGPCGCGKTTLTEACAKTLDAPAYIIHGDDLQAGFVTPEHAEGPSWPDILAFNWACILANARCALQLGVDVVIDYVVEDELPLVRSLAVELGTTLYYIVLTASEDTLRNRLQERGDAWLTDRALFLKAKLDTMPENQGHLYDITGMSVEQELQELHPERFIVT